MINEILAGEEGIAMAGEELLTVSEDERRQAWQMSAEKYDLDRQDDLTEAHYAGVAKGYAQAEAKYLELISVKDGQIQQALGQLSFIDKLIQQALEMLSDRNEQFWQVLRELSHKDEQIRQLEEEVRLLQGVINEIQGDEEDLNGRSREEGERNRTVL
ncbi:MAG: hypothetical protein LBL43_05015 [Treponema sp.]|jgi:hypothetical protein|nr:hypothetical protein [Treponema sp.]